MSVEPITAAGTDPRKGGVWGDHSRAGEPWTDEEDVRLIAWGMAVGHDFVAGHDFNRVPAEGDARMAWLRLHRPLVVRRIEQETNREP
ncbi:MAG: hypothetical protein ACRYHQ_16140 [Janthinobacterium lividum]